MKLFRSMCIWGVALSLVAVSAARGEEGSEPARAESGDCPCCESTTHCPVLRAAETTVAKTPACGKSLSCPGMKLGGVTPRIIVSEKEECLLGLTASGEPDCCKGSNCCAESATACKGKSEKCHKPQQVAIELELECGAKVAANSACCEKDCTAANGKSACCETACTKAACTKTAGCKASCESVTAKHPSGCDNEAFTFFVGHSETGHCGEGCACADKCQCAKNAQAGSCCSERKAKSTTSDCPSRHFGRDTEQTAKALAELMERLGPSLIEGTEFERVPSFQAPTPESFDRPVSIREELVDYIRCLAAGEEPTEEVAAEIICTDNECQDTVAATVHEREEAVHSLRQAAMVLDQTAAELERNNLYDASDRTRELANQLRQKGRHLRMIDTGSVRMEAVPASCQEGTCPQSQAKPVAHKPIDLGGWEVQY